MTNKKNISIGADIDEDLNIEVEKIIHEERKFLPTVVQKAFNRSSYLKQLIINDVERRKRNKSKRRNKL